MHVQCVCVPLIVALLRVYSPYEYSKMSANGARTALYSYIMWSSELTAQPRRNRSRPCGECRNGRPSSVKREFFQFESVPGDQSDAANVAECVCVRSLRGVCLARVSSAAKLRECCDWCPLTKFGSKAERKMKFLRGIRQIIEWIEANVHV